MAPHDRDEGADNGGDDVDNERKAPRYGHVRRRPEQPCLNVILDELAMIGWVGLVPEEVDEQRRGDDETGKYGRPDESGE